MNLMNKIAIISLFTLFTLSCNESKDADTSLNRYYTIDDSPMIEVDNYEGLFHGELKYYDSESTLRLKQMWSKGRVNGFSKFFDADGLLIFEKIQTDSTFKVTYGYPYNSELDFLTNDLANYFIDMAQIEFLDSLNFNEPFKFRFNNIPETYLTVSVHGHHLRRNGRVWEIIPKKIEDSLKIDISFDLNNVIHKKTFTTSFN